MNYKNPELPAMQDCAVTKKPNCCQKIPVKSISTSKNVQDKQVAYMD